MAPSLWQELWTKELLEQQKERIKRELQLQLVDNEEGIDEERDVCIRISKDIALSNLEERINQKNLLDSEDKQLLRKDFYRFLKSEVGENEDICINLTDACDSEYAFESYYTDLILFHSDEQFYKKVVRGESQSDIVGYCDTLLEYSELCKKWGDEATEERVMYFEKIEKEERKTKRMTFIKNIGYFVICFVFVGIMIMMAFERSTISWKGIGGMFFFLIGCVIFGVRIYDSIREWNKKTRR